MVISHNRDGVWLSEDTFADLEDVHLRFVDGVLLADYSLQQSLLEGMEWVHGRGLRYDWFVRLSGQCYPTQSLTTFERVLATTEYDGFMLHHDPFANDSSNPWGKRDGEARCLYHYRRLTKQTPREPVRKALVIPRRIVNSVQPFVRVETNYGIHLGVRQWRTPFNEQQRCYGSIYFKTLSRRAVERIFTAAAEQRELAAYLRQVWMPEEVYESTLLVNDPTLRFCNNNLYYVDWNGARFGSSRTLTLADYDAIVTSGAHFARKLDITYDAAIFDRLDARIFAGAHHEEQGNERTTTAGVLHEAHHLP